MYKVLFLGILRNCDLITRFFRNEKYREIRNTNIDWTKWYNNSQILFLRCVLYWLFIYMYIYKCHYKDCQYNYISIEISWLEYNIYSYSSCNFFFIYLRERFFSLCLILNFDIHAEWNFFPFYYLKDLLTV